MWRVAILACLMFTATLVLRAESGSPQVVNTALVQVQHCLELGGAKLAPILPGEGGESPGLTWRSLFATLAIGILSILFCVPAALVAEYLSRSGGNTTGAAS